MAALVIELNMELSAFKEPISGCLNCPFMNEYEFDECGDATYYCNASRLHRDICKNDIDEWADKKLEDCPISNSYIK